MDIESYLRQRGLEPEELQTKFGRPETSQLLLNAIQIMEDRIALTDYRIEVVRQLLIKTQPKSYGALGVTWMVIDGVVKPRVFQWRRSRKTGKWIKLTLSDSGFHKSLNTSGKFALNAELNRKLVGKLNYLFKLRSESVDFISVTKKSIDMKSRHDPFMRLDLELEGLISRAVEITDNQAATD